MDTLRGLFVTIVIILSGLMAADGYADTRRYAAFVADANTGEILHSRLADAQRYPASLTKMMTLYLLFEAIEAGDLSLTDTLTAIADRRQPAAVQSESVPGRYNYRRDRHSCPGDQERQ